jgi:uncharacterized protein YbjT (DUF2867 family)
MKFVVTGAAGHVSKPLTELLLKKGHDVTVVGRSPKNLEGLVTFGAKTAIGDMGDVAFLTEAFKGAFRSSALCKAISDFAPQSGRYIWLPVQRLFRVKSGSNVSIRTRPK